ncbi:MAG: glycosyltransferase family 39 protein [Chloroflexi bacterium]|nr:glycosyltransferase family 39 protein [Chloroflexota bacterium]
MTLWDAYLLFLHRLGLGPKPAVEADIRFTLSSLAPSAPAIHWRELNLWQWMGLPGAFLLAIIGQLLILGGTSFVGAVLMLIGAGLFVLAAWRSAISLRNDSMIPTQPPLIQTSEFSPTPLRYGALRENSEVLERPLTLVERSPLFIAALSLSLITFLLVGDNNIPTLGFITWGVSTLLWLLLFWEMDSKWIAWMWRREVSWKPLENWINDQRLKIVVLWRDGVDFKFTAKLFFFLLILIVSAYFRFTRLNDVPIETTSDHVEKLLDVNDILNNGVRPIFEPANGGREPMTFYLIALTSYFTNLPLNHFLLKLVMAIVGFITLPFFFLLARELFEDDLLAMITMLLAGISWWANLISRNGLRFPFAPLFGAIALWLLIAAVKRSRRNLALLAGLAAGVGLYGYTPMRAVPIAFIVLLIVFAIHQRESWGKAIRFFGVALIILLAVYVPMIRYGIDEPENYWRRSLTRMLGDPSPDVLPAPPLLPTLVSNEWNSLTMFFYTADNAWLVSPAGQPALDWVMSACFLMGIAFLLYRYIRWRDWRDLFLLIIIPILLSPSTGALALPTENPSLTRSGLMLAVVFLIAAIPLRITIEYGRKLISDWRGTLVGVVIAGALIVTSAQVNTTGAWDTVIVRAFPYWVDTRAVGIYAGKFGWDNVILDGQPLVPENWQNDPRPKLYILNRHDAKTIAELRAAYPKGILTYQPSNFFDKDFLTFFVPGTVDFNEHTIPPKP